LAGLALAYILQVTQLLSLCIRQFTDTEVQLVSIERLNHYATSIETEAPPIIEHNRPESNWPNAGRISFENVSMRYQPSLPLVLKEVSISIKAHEKVL
jgi:ATP-binding cassette, subfamily C (CFTR/MRP), member 1